MASVWFFSGTFDARTGITPLAFEQKGFAFVWSRLKEVPACHHEWNQRPTIQAALKEIHSDSVKTP